MTVAVVENWDKDYIVPAFVTRSTEMVEGMGSNSLVPRPPLQQSPPFLLEEGLGMRQGRQKLGVEKILDQETPETHSIMLRNASLET